MADVHPLRALHYDLGKAGPLDTLTAPPYDVIGPAQRTQLAAKSPYNVVEIDLPQAEDPYGHAAALIERWKSDGVLVRDGQPALWALTQTYRAPDGSEQTRRGFFCRVRVTEYGSGLIRPHERTHPAPKEDRLRLTRATAANLSPIFALYPDPGMSAWAAVEPATSTEPWGAVTDEDGTTHRLWRVADTEVINLVRRRLTGRELLIADGHHRYETARHYADEIGGEGEHRYVLTCLTSLSDPGLTVLPTHRLVRGLDAAQRQRLAELIEREFHTREVDRDRLAPEPGRAGALPVYGYLEADRNRPMRLELRSAKPLEQAFAGHSEAYRRLDSAVLEKLVLEQALGLSDDDIMRQRGLGYARDLDETLRQLRDREYELAFLLRPTPIEQMRKIAQAGETMPPKSTYFFPKLLSGMLFNPLGSRQEARR